MSKYSINDTTLTAIADSIRTKGGTSDPIQVSNFATAISNLPSGGGEITAEDLAFTGNISNLFTNNNWAFIIDDYSNLISFTDITDAQNLFYNSDERTDLSMLTINTKLVNFQNAFSNCNNLVKLPIVNGTLMRYLYYFFINCYRLPSSEINNFFSNISVPANESNTFLGSLFQACYSARDLTTALSWIDENMNNYSGTGNTWNGTYYYFLYYCVSLDGVTNFPVVNIGNRTDNIFSSAFNYCFRMKDLIFRTDEGVPLVVNWKGQTIDLTVNFGYLSASGQHYILNYNSGITADKEVTDDATYQALKNDPDWYTTDIAYSRYNHDSAVATINSLPDTSAYLATAGGTNTIKFKGESGSATDGGAINTLTEEEIAVAIAKGWTVTLT